MTAKRNILVTSALPYASGPLHLGHLVEYTQTDIWVRFQRMRGHRCIYVCASDAHGTPTMLRADAAGVAPEALVTEVAEGHQEGFRAIPNQRRQLPDDPLRGKPGTHHGDVSAPQGERIHRPPGHHPGLRRAAAHVPAGSLRARRVPVLRRCGSVRRRLRELQCHVCAHGSEESRVGGVRYHALAARIRAFFLPAERIRGRTAGMGT